MADEEIDMVGLFYKLANAEQEGKDATLDRKKITMALKVLNLHWINILLKQVCKLTNRLITELLEKLHQIDGIWFSKITEQRIL